MHRTRQCDLAGADYAGAQFAESFERRGGLCARSVRWPRFGAGAQGYASLAGLVGPAGRSGLFLDDRTKREMAGTFVAGAPLLQMVADNGIAPHRDASLRTAHAGDRRTRHSRIPRR